MIAECGKRFLARWEQGWPSKTYQPLQNGQNRWVMNPVHIGNGKLNSPVGKPGPPVCSKLDRRLTRFQEKTHAMSELTGRWALIDPAATAEWLNAQPSSPDNDPAIATFVSRIQGMDPQGAVGWAASISDPSLRENPSNRQSMPGSRPILKKLIFG